MARKEKDVEEYLSLLGDRNPFTLAPRNNSWLEKTVEKDGFPGIHIDNRIITNRIERMFDNCTFINCHFHF